jgi:capsular polysaccharide transport system permease protein
MFMPLYFASGILFSVTRFADEWVRWLAYNPVLHLVELTRAVAIDEYEPMKYMSIAYPLVLALTTTAIGLMLYRLRFLARVTQ